MAKLTTVDVTNLSNESSFANTLNNNFGLTETALENTLSRDGATPNQMEAPFDMNSNQIINLPAPLLDNNAARKVDITKITGLLLHATSASSVVLGLGTKTLIVENGKAYYPGMILLLRDTSTSANSITGTVTSYSGSTLVVEAVSFTGSGTGISWTVDLTGLNGTNGIIGSNGINGTNGTNGQGVPVGGSANQILSKLSSTSYDTQWVDPQEVLTSGRNIYVRTDGSDSNNGNTDTAGGAYLTIQAAVNRAQSINGNGHQITIRIADGTYAGTVTVSSPLIGGGTLDIRGNLTTPSNVVLTATNSVFLINKKSVVKVIGVKMTCSAGQAIFLDDATLFFGSVDFGTCPSYHIVSKGGIVECTSNYTISGNTGRHLYLYNNSRMQLAGKTVTLLNSPVFTYFLFVDLLSLFISFSLTFVNTASGIRYLSRHNSVIQTFGGGASFFPGTSNGSASSGGIYV